MITETTMNRNVRNLSEDGIKDITSRQLDKLIQGQLYLPHGLQEGDLLNLAPKYTTDKRKKNRLSKEFTFFCHSLLSDTLEDKSIFPENTDKQRKKLLKKTLQSHQAYILQVIRDYVDEKMGVPKKKNSMDDEKKGKEDENDKEQNHVTVEENGRASSASDTGLEEDSNDEALSKRKKKKRNKKEKKNKKDRKKKKIRTKFYAGESDGDMSKYEESDEDVQVREMMPDSPLLQEAMRLFEAEKKKVMDKIPGYIKNDFRQIGFTKWGKQMLPVIQLGPYDVEPGPVRDQWLKMFNNCLKTSRKPSRLVMWYGTVWESRSEAYSFVAKNKLTSFEVGKAKGYDKAPAALIKKITDGRELTEKENFHIQGLDQMKKDLSLPLEERISWMSRFTEDYEKYLHKSDDDDFDSDENMEKSIPKARRKLTKLKKKESNESKKEIDDTNILEHNIDFDSKVNAEPHFVNTMDKKKKSSKKKVEVEFSAEAKHELLNTSGREKFKIIDDDSVSSPNEGVQEVSYKQKKQRKGEKDSKVKKKKRKYSDDNKKVEKRKKLSDHHKNDLIITNKGTGNHNYVEILPDGEENGINVHDQEDIPLEVQYRQEQEKFEECERILNPILQKIRHALETRDDIKVIKSLDELEIHFSILTKSFIEHASMGPLMKKLKKTFKHTSRKAFERCKDCTNQLRDLYGRGKTPDGFVPKIKPNLITLSSMNKEEIPKIEENLSKKPIPHKNNEPLRLTENACEVIIPKKIEIKHEEEQKNSQNTKPFESQPTFTPSESKRKKPKFSLFNMIEGSKKNITSTPVMPSQLKDVKKNTQTHSSSTSIKKQIPKWLTEKPNCFDSPLLDDQKFAIKFLEDSLLSFPPSINRIFAARALEQAVRQWCMEIDRFKKFRSELYWEKIHYICAAFRGMVSPGTLVQAVIDGDYKDPLSIVRLQQKALYDLFCSQS